MAAKICRDNTAQQIAICIGDRYIGREKFLLSSCGNVSSTRRLT